MNMQDKELDALFKDRLDDLEMEPSANLWAGIAAELDAGKKKKPIAIYLSAAATVVLLITAGIVFMPKTGNVTNGQEPKNNIAKQNNAVKPAVAEKTVKHQVEVPVVVNAPVAQHIAVAEIKTTKAAKVAKVNTVAPVAAPTEQVIAAVSTKSELLKPVVPDVDVPLTEKTISNQPEPFETKPVVMAAAAQPQTDATAETQQPVKKKKINSFGGLLNALVAKIDKRKDKLIEFSDADENSVTGVNLGILKIKKEEE